MKRDEDACQLRRNGISVEQFQDHLIFRPDAILKDNGSPFLVFTPFYKKWRARLDAQGAPLQYEVDLKRIQSGPNPAPDSVEGILEFAGFELDPPPLEGGESAAFSRLDAFLTVIDDYKLKRDFPALDNTSLMSVYTGMAVLVPVS